MKSHITKLFLFLAFATTMSFAQSTKTDIRDVVYNSDGSYASGTLIVTWPPFRTPGGESVPGGGVTVTIGREGRVSLSLIPNAGAVPSGSYYKAEYQFADGSSNTEYWEVPALPATNISAIRSAVLTRGVPAHAATENDDRLGENAASLLGKAALTRPVKFAREPGTSGEAKAYDSRDAGPLDQSRATSPIAVYTTPSGPQTIQQPPGTSLSVNMLQDKYYASQFQNPAGTGNNGIANAVASACAGAGCEVIAEPGYSTTESVGGTNDGPYGGNLYIAPPNFPNLTHFRDDRGGLSTDYYALNGTAQFNPHYEHRWLLNSSYQVTGPTLVQQGFEFQSLFTGPGNQINGFGGVNLKSYDFGTVINMVSADQGQHLNQNNNVLCTGVGDCIDFTEYVTVDGGQSTYNDEGAHLGDRAVVEDNNVFAGTITNVGTGTLQVSPSQGAGTQGDGRYLIDTAASKVISGTFPTAYVSYTDRSTNLAPPGEIFVGTTFTPSWIGMVCYPGVDTCASGVDPSGRINSAANGYAPGTITFNVLTSAPSMKTGYATTTAGLPPTGIACVADNEFFETTAYTVVGISQISLNLRKPHFDGMTVGIGSACQTGLEVTGGTFKYAPNGQPYRQVFPVVGSLSPTELLVFDHDSQQGWSNAVLGNNGSAFCSTDNVSNFQVNGTNVTFQEANGYSPNSAFAQQNATITTANSSYNGAYPIRIISVYSGGEFIRVYQYTLPTAPSGVVPASGTAQVCNTSFNLFPAVEVTDVRDPNTNAVDGYFQLAPNSVSWAANDTVEEPHYFWQFNTLTPLPYAVDQKMPRPPLNSWPSAGVTYNSLMSGGYFGWSVENQTSVNRFQYYGGAVPVPVGAYMVNGMWKNDLSILNPPAIDGSIISVAACQPAPYGCGDQVNSPIAIYTGPTANHVIVDNTANNTMGIRGTAWQIGELGFPVTFYEPSAGTLNISSDLGGFAADATVNAGGFNGTLGASTPAPAIVTNLTVNGKVLGSLELSTGNPIVTQFALSNTFPGGMTWGFNDLTPGTQQMYTKNSSGQVVLYDGTNSLPNYGAYFNGTQEVLGAPPAGLLQFSNAVAATAVTYMSQDVSTNTLDCGSGFQIGDCTFQAGTVNAALNGTLGANKPSPAIVTNLTVTGTCSGCGGTPSNGTLTAVGPNPTTYGEIQFEETSSDSSLSRQVGSFDPTSGEFTADFGISAPAVNTQAVSTSTVAASSSIATPQLTVGSSSTLRGITFYSTGLITPSAVPANTCNDEKFTVSGLQSIDNLGAIKPPANLGNMSIDGYVSAANTLTLHLCNLSQASAAPPSGAYTFLAMH